MASVQPPTAPAPRGKRNTSIKVKPAEPPPTRQVHTMPDAVWMRYQVLTFQCVMLALFTFFGCGLVIDFKSLGFVFLGFPFDNPALWAWVFVLTALFLFTSILSTLLRPDLSRIRDRAGSAVFIVCLIFGSDRLTTAIARHTGYAGAAIMIAFALMALRAIVIEHKDNALDVVDRIGTRLARGVQAKGGS